MPSLESYLLSISIHALREEGDRDYVRVRVHLTEFLSTPSARRATRKKAKATEIEVISIHALREEGDQGTVDIAQATPISIHALREEGDTGRTPEYHDSSNFYPRPPRGGRLLAHSPPCHEVHISIHALREEGDLPRHRKHWQNSNFYPRPPRGGRPESVLFCR